MLDILLYIFYFEVDNLTFHVYIAIYIEKKTKKNTNKIILDFLCTISLCIYVYIEIFNYNILHINFKNWKQKNYYKLNNKCKFFTE